MSDQLETLTAELDALALDYADIQVDRDKLQTELFNARQLVQTQAAKLNNQLQTLLKRDARIFELEAELNEARRMETDLHLALAQMIREVKKHMDQNSVGLNLVSAYSNSLRVFNRSTMRPAYITPTEETTNEGTDF